MDKSRKEAPRIIKIETLIQKEEANLRNEWRECERMTYRKKRRESDGRERLAEERVGRE